MKSLIVIFLAIFMIGLLFFDSAVREKTSALVVEKSPWVNPVFKPALKYFFAEAKKRKIDISKFAKIDSIKYGLYPEAKDTIVGICQKKLLGKRIIGIKPGIRDPKKIIRHAVSGMLPKNKLRAKRLVRLRIFIDEKHPYQDKKLIDLKI